MAAVQNEGAAPGILRDSPFFFLEFPGGNRQNAIPTVTPGHTKNPPFAMSP